MRKKNKNSRVRRKEKGKSPIAYQNKDITSKVLAEEFEGKTFAVYGIDIPRIVKVEPTNLPAIEANELRMDNLFLLEDGSYAILDYESEYLRGNYSKYLSYIVRVSERLYNTFKEYPRIRMIVIYTADVEKGTTNPVLDIGCMQVLLDEAFLSDLDHESIWKEVSYKIVNRRDISSDEIMKLIVYPLIFKELIDKQNAIQRVIQLVKLMENSRQKTFIFKCLTVFTDKIIRREDAEQIKEALMLTQVEQLFYEDFAVKIAKKLIEQGDEYNKVAEVTELPLDVVIKIANEIAAEKQQQ